MRNNTGIEVRIRVCIILIPDLNPNHHQLQLVLGSSSRGAGSLLPPSYTAALPSSLWLATRLSHCRHLMMRLTGDSHSQHGTSVCALPWWGRSCSCTSC